MTLPSTARNWWNREAYADERYRTLAWGGDGTPEAVQPTINAILKNLTSITSTLPDPATVLEIGCGPGRILHRLARLYPDWQLHGADVSDEMVDLGTLDRPPNVTVHVTDGTSLPDLKADLIYTVEVFQHIDHATKRAYMHAIADTLTPKGLAVIQYVVGIDEGFIVNHPETEANMKSLVKDAGLKVKRITVPNQIHDEWRWMVVGR